MATVGQVLLVPETGWKKYDDRDSLLTYTNASAVTASADNTIIQGNGLTLKFLIYGTKFRIIAHNYTHGTVVIDGISYPMTAQAGYNFDTLMFEKLDLSLGSHKIEFTSVSTAWITAIHVGIDDYIMKYRAVGTQLLTPDSGWLRTDDLDSRISYKGTWTRSSDIHYNGSINKSNVYGDTIKIKFYGTMFRIIQSKTANDDSNIIITIDGVQYNYSAYNSTSLYQIMTFEKIGLPLQLHEIVITKGTNSSTYFGLDAIDIDSNGYLVDIVILKYLIQDGTELKTISGSNLVTVCNTTDDNSTIESAFLTNGLDNLSAWNNSLASQIVNNTFKVAIYRKEG